MMTKKLKTIEADRTDCRIYQKKASGFFNVMNMCLQDNEWDSVLLNGVHAALSMNDALCVYFLGKRSSGKSHNDAIFLLGQIEQHSSEVRKNANRLSDILGEKNKIAYEPVVYGEKDAKDFALTVERFFSWAESILPKIP